MSAIQFTSDDRDDRGFIAVNPAMAAAEPRSLADLLPSTVAPAQPPTARPIALSKLIAPLITMALLIVAFVAASARPGAAPPVVPAAQPLPTIAPTAAGAPATRLLIAFAAPDGQPLGAIESTRAITPTAHYGDTWIQADVAGSGLVWLRASDAPDLPIVGPDLTPRRPVIASAPAPVAPAPIAATEPPPPPPPCAEAGIPGKMVHVCGYEDLGALQERAKAEWLATYGGNAGTVDHPTPQPMPSRATLLSGEEDRP